jgi:alkanesulfonate monooxygenase SsuD/methylene tetrahydromethanopterin reductase-like flavin-dependent oxidoreductase (luciferase family)
MMDPHSSMEDIAMKRQIYDTALRDNDFDPGGRDIPVARLLAIAPTDEQARRVAETGAQWTTNSYAKNPLSMKPQEGEVDPVQRYVDNVILWGSPERVADLLMQYEAEKQLNYLLCAPLSNQSFQMFNEEVLPRLT